jgi:RNA polymerase sigma factor (sigma-70 family)
MSDRRRETIMPSLSLSRLLGQLRHTLGSQAGGGLTDTQLLERWIEKRDEAALEVLLWRHGPMVLGVCRRVLRHEHNAEDAFQATFLTLVHRAASIRHREALGSWLYRVAYRAALAAKAETVRHAVPWPLTDLPARPESEAVPRELWQVLDEELNRLPEKYRRPFVLCYLQGRTNDEAGRELNCTRGTVATRLAFARRRLRSSLARRGIALSAGALLAAWPHASQAAPGKLVAATLRAAVVFTAGGTAAAFSPQVIHLARGVMKAMFLTRLKGTVAMGLALVLLAIGVGLTSQSGQSPRQLHARAPLAPRDPAPKPPEKPHPVRAIKDTLLRWGGGNAESEAAVAAGLDWLSRHQAADGHWTMEGLQAQGRDTAATALALLPFLGAGLTHQSKGEEGAHAKVIELGLKWLVAQQTKQGQFGGEMYTHALATMALCQAYGLTSDPWLKEPAQHAIDYIVAGQHATGGWRYQPGQSGDTSVTGWQVQALWMGKNSGLDVPKATLDGVGKWLDSCQTADGGYGYIGPQATPTMTAAGLLCRQMLGWDSRQPLLVSGIGQLKQTGPGSLNSAYFHYYASHALFLNGGRTWDEWNAKMRDHLLKTQEKGDKAGAAEHKGSWPQTGDQFGVTGRVYVTSLALMTLEVYYRLDLVLEAQAPRDVAVKDLDRLWTDLASPELKGRQTAWVLTRAPRQAVALFREKVRPPRSPDATEVKRIGQLIRDLDSDEFSKRDKATEELGRLEDKADGALRKALDGQPSVEARRRMERLIEKLDGVNASEKMRTLRALGVLERIETSEGRELLELLAKGDADAWLTKEAKAALERLEKRK